MKAKITFDELKVSEVFDDSTELVETPEKLFKMRPLEKTKMFISKLKDFESCNNKDNKKMSSINKTTKLIDNKKMSSKNKTTKLIVSIKGFESSMEKYNNEITESRNSNFLQLSAVRDAKEYSVRLKVSQNKNNLIELVKTPEKLFKISSLEKTKKLSLN